MNATWGERTERYLEYFLRLPVAIAELGKAYAHAQHTAKEKGIDTSYDDWCTVDHDDENLILRIKLKDT